MCKAPSILGKKNTDKSNPLFKPYSSFESKHYIKKLTNRIK